MTIDTHELAWAAGFYDGEGTMGSHSPTERSKCGRKKYPRLGMSIHQVDKRPLKRFQAAIGGLGGIGGPYHHGTSKPIHQWTTQNYEHAQAAIAMLWKYLSEPKREQAMLAMREVSRTNQIPRIGRWAKCRSYRRVVA